MPSGGLAGSGRPSRLLLRESGDGREAEALLPMRGVLRKRRGGGEDEQERRMSWLFRREAEGERGRKTIPCPASSFRLVAQGDDRPLAPETRREGCHRYSMLMRKTFRRGRWKLCKVGGACQSGEIHRPRGLAPDGLSGFRVMGEALVPGAPDRTTSSGLRFRQDSLRVRGAGASRPQSMSLLGRNVFMRAAFRRRPAAEKQGMPSGGGVGWASSGIVVRTERGHFCTGRTGGDAFAEPFLLRQAKRGFGRRAARRPCNLPSGQVQ